MHFFPKGRDGWLQFAIFPFKAYIFISPIIFYISRQFPRPRHTGGTDLEMGIMLGLILCGIFLWVTGLFLALSRLHALTVECFAYGTLALIFSYFVGPDLAVA